MTCPRCHLKVFGSGHASAQDCIDRLTMRQANLGRSLKSEKSRNWMLKRHLERAKEDRHLAQDKAKKLAARMATIERAMKGTS